MTPTFSLLLRHVTGVLITSLMRNQYIVTNQAVAHQTQQGSSSISRFCTRITFNRYKAAALENWELRTL